MVLMGLVTRGLISLALAGLMLPAMASDVQAPFVVSSAKAVAASAPASAPHTRPRIGLVLSGGGARGIAHVGVLKILERERIPIDVISGTSMGAIVGGLYASGMSAAQIEAELLKVNWSEVFTNRVDRPLLSQRLKEDDFKLSPALEFGMNNGELRAPMSALYGRGFEALLRRYTMPVRNLSDFSKLPIPFRAVATNMESGKQVVLGSGDPALEAAMRGLAARFPGRVGTRIGYDEGMSHRLFAGGDAVLVPSRFEPCGLTQMYGLRYGTLPVVAATGGLADTVIGATPATLAAGVATGIVFAPTDALGLALALRRLTELYADRDTWDRLQRNAMKHPVGWEASAAAYARLYEGLGG